MWERLSDPVMTYLDPVGVVLGLLIAVPVFWTWWEVTIGRRRRYRRWFRELRESPGNRPAILIVDLLPGRDITPSVEAFRQASDQLRAIPPERVFTITRDVRLSPDDMPRLHQDVRMAAAEALRTGVDVLHYFHAGPAVAAAVVGAELANACRVLIYQHDSSAGTYAGFGPIRML